MSIDVILPVSLLFPRNFYMCKFRLCVTQTKSFGSVKSDEHSDMTAVTQSLKVHLLMENLDRAYL